jgi:hypothetical protein
MSQLQELTDNITTDFVTKSDLKYFITSIFNDVPLIKLMDIASMPHPSGKTNYDFHYTQTLSQIEKVSNAFGKLDYIINRISISRHNKINIDVHIQKSDEKINFYIIGPDLKDYYMFLPKIRCGHIVYPRTGSSNSKWYGEECKKKFVIISVSLKLLEIMLMRVKIVKSYSTSITGILGVEVPFEIPQKYTYGDIITSCEQITNPQNPIKVSPGIFLYGKNGIDIKSINKLLDVLRSLFTHINEQVYPTIIEEYDLSDYISSQYRFAICTWDRHARILVKSDKNIILIIDPWMNTLPLIIKNKLLDVNNSIYINFLSRNIKDQKNEGSCVFCALSRLISLVDSCEPIKINANKPIDDFYAYLIKTIYFLQRELF